MFLPLLLQGKDQEAVIQDSPVHKISGGIERTSDRPVNNAGQKQIQILNNLVNKLFIIGCFLSLRGNLLNFKFLCINEIQFEGINVAKQHQYLKWESF